MMHFCSVIDIVNMLATASNTYFLYTVPNILPDHLATKVHCVKIPIGESNSSKDTYTIHQAIKVTVVAKSLQKLVVEYTPWGNFTKDEYRFVKRMERAYHTLRIHTLA